MSKYIVTIAPPMPNGDLHIGHLFGPYLAGDICTRVLRQQDHDVLLLCYSDDYQSYLLRKAREESMDLRDIALCNMEDTSIMRLVWQIRRLYSQLRELYLGATHHPALAEFLSKTLQRETDKWLLTRPGESAIPLDNYPDQPIHTRFGGLAGYRATLLEHLANQGQADQIATWWHPDTGLVQFLGLDCAYSHVVTYAALINLERTGPSRLYHFTNPFLKLDGEDLSTSRNHAICIREIVENHPVDAVRFYAALKSPENDIQNFSQNDFQDWVTTHYIPRLANGSWKSGDHPSSTMPSRETWRLFQPLLMDWRDACSLDTFLISGIANMQMRILEVVEQAQVTEQDCLWLFYSHLGQAIHPTLSTEIQGVITERCPSAVGWLESVMNKR